MIPPYQISNDISTIFQKNTFPIPMVLAKQKKTLGPLRSRSFPLTTVEDPPSQKYQRYGFCPVSGIPRMDDQIVTKDILGRIILYNNQPG